MIGSNQEGSRSELGLEMKNRAARVAWRLVEEGLVQQPQGPQSVLVPVFPRGLEKQGLEGGGSILAGTEMTTLSKLCKTPKRPAGFVLPPPPQGSVSLLPNLSSLVTINVRVRAIRRLCLDK